MYVFFFFKQKTAYEMRISDWSSDVCSSDLLIDNLNACAEAIGEAGALGIDNQGESCLAWNAETKEAVSPVIVWQDSRTAGIIESLKQDGAEAATLARAGLPPDAYFSAAKLAWIVAHKIGRASCRERVWTLRWLSVVAVT